MADPNHLPVARHLKAVMHPVGLAWILEMALLAVVALVILQCLWLGWQYLSFIMDE